LSISKKIDTFFLIYSVTEAYLCHLQSYYFSMIQRIPELQGFTLKHWLFQVHKTRESQSACCPKAANLNH